MSGLTAPRNIYGVHSVTPYSRADGSYYGIIKVVESSSLSLSGKQNDLFGGSNKYAVASETGEINSEMSLKIAEMPDFAFYLFLGKLPTKTTAETGGAVTTAVNVKGTSMIAATGLLTPSVTASTGAAQLKFGKYLLKAVSATAFDVYNATDIDLTRGTAEPYLDDTLVLAHVTGVATGATSAVANLGLDFVGGASATAFVVGDTCVFDVRPVNLKSSVVRVGAAADVFPEFGCVVMAQKRGSDELSELDIFRCKASGMPIGFDMFAWAKTDIKVKVLYDSAKDGVFDARFVSNAT